MEWEEPSRQDLERLAAQLGREPRGRVFVASRCPFGRVQVAATAPRLDDGTPFPTLYWLSCPVLRSEVSRLEAGGFRRRLREMLEDQGFLRRLTAAERSYSREREELASRLGLAGETGRWGGLKGVGGSKPGSLKCLHAHYAHYLAGGDNPVGEMVHVELGEDRLRRCGGECP